MSSSLPNTIVASRAPAATISVLVVEDHEGVRLLSLFLRRNHFATYELDWAPTHAAGLAAIRRHAYDIGIFGYRLGQRTGLDLLREARAEGLDMPVILLTEQKDPEVDQMASLAGAADCLCRMGLDSFQLEEAIRSGLNQAGLPDPRHQNRSQKLPSSNVIEGNHDQERLRHLARLLDGILSNLPVIVSSVDESGMIFESRGCALTAVGMVDGELVGRNILELCPSVAAEIERAIAGGEAKITWSIDQGGSRHYFDTILRFDEIRGRGAVAFSVNVTARIHAETERNRKDQLLNSIIKNLPVIAGRINAAGNVTHAQGEGLVTRGFSPAQLTGQVFWNVYPQSASALQSAIRGEAVSFVLSGQANGNDWHAEFFAGFDAENGSGAIFFGRDITPRRWLEQKLINITDAEQRRIGADLHDSVGQQLTGLSCLAAALNKHLQTKGDTDGAKEAWTIMHLASDTIAQSRALARGLCPVQLEQSGLQSALEDLTFNAQRLHGVDCRFLAEGTVSYDHPNAVHLYRITQEAINNAIRHAAARHILVVLRSRPNDGQLIIEDDGVGFEATFLNNKDGGRGIGLSMMNYRAAIIGADFHLNSRPGEGTRIECTFAPAQS